MIGAEQGQLQMIEVRYYLKKTKINKLELVDKSSQQKKDQTKNATSSKIAKEYIDSKWPKTMWDNMSGFWRMQVC